MKRLNPTVERILQAAVLLLAIGILIYATR